MRVLITGSTGMVGKGVALECIDDPSITEVVLINRREGNISHPKVREIIHKDFQDISGVSDQLSGLDACFFCMGVSAAGMSEEKYTSLTYDLTKKFARHFIEQNPNAIFTYVSGQGTDSTERGRIMWARVKGRTENEILAMGFKAAYALRPGFIAPKRGIRSSTRLYQIIYDILWIFMPLINLIGPKGMTDTTRLGKAHIELLNGSDKKVLDPVDINALAARLDERNSGI